MVKKAKLAKQSILNINIHLPNSADPAKYDFLEEILGEFIMLRDGKLMRGHDDRLKTAYADIGQPLSKYHTYHVHYAKGSVGYLEKHKGEWYVKEDYEEFQCYDIKTLKEKQPMLIEQPLTQ